MTNLASPKTGNGRSPVLAILASLFAGAAFAIALLLGPAWGASEPMITGSVMFAFGLGWGLMAFLSTRFSGQPQRWMAVPAVCLGFVGLGLIVFQPSGSAMDRLSWVWPGALIALGVWMLIQVRRHLHGRGRLLVVPTIAVLMLVAVGGGLETLIAATGSSTDAPTGHLVDVGGHRLYIECSGSGSPTVVLESGLAESASYWAHIAPAVAASTTICVYDRAGRGRSDEAAGSQDGTTVAIDLHTLLAGAGVPGPYVLAGHSSGGVYVRAFAARYADEVAGMVELDAQPADPFTQLPDYPAFYQLYRPAMALSPSLARIGALRLIAEAPDQTSPGYARSVRDEVAALPSALRDARSLTSLGARPLIVVTAGAGQPTGWLEGQDELARLSTSSVHRVIAAATHNSLISGVDATASSDAILDVVASIRGGTALR